MSKTQFVDFKAVKREVSMVKVLEHYGLMSVMRQNGDSITGACPIHEGNNKTAFRVSISKNCWNCFSQCGCGGNVLDFVSKKEGVSLLKAANLLIEWFSLEIEASEADDSSHKVKSDSRVRENKPVKRETAKPRTETPAGSEEAKGENKPLGFALKDLEPNHPYLTERGLLPETIQAFGMGFCQKGLQAGRVVIPIHNLKGEIVAYAGRWPGEPPNEDTERYKFPPKFKKTWEVFNLHRVINEPPDGPLYVVEGFFGCMKLWQHGIRRVVSLMGSSMSPMQEELIRTLTNSRCQIIVMLDEDKAGRNAREEIAGRLAKFAFVKVHVFDKPEMQPENLSAEEVRHFLPERR